MAAGPNDFHLLPATPVDVWRNNYIEFLDMVMLLAFLMSFLCCAAV